MKRERTWRRLLTLALILSMLLSSMVPGLSVLAAGNADGVENFSGYETGAVDSTAMTAFDFGSTDHFSVVTDDEAHGKVLKGTLGSEKGGNYFDVATTYQEKRITFEFKATGETRPYNGLYLFLNKEGSARAIASPSDVSKDFSVQNGAGSNLWMGGKSFVEDQWYTMVVEYTNDAFRMKAYPTGSEQAAWDYEGANFVAPADYSSTPRFLLLNEAGYTADYYFDNILIEDLAPKVESAEETFSAYETGAVATDAIPGMTLGGSEFTIAEDGEHGNVLKGVLGSEADGNYFTVSSEYKQKRISFDFKAEGTIDEWNGLYLFLNDEGTARMVASPDKSGDVYLQNGDSNNVSPKVSGKVSVGKWYTAIIEYTDAAVRIKVFAEGTEQAAWDYDVANYINTANYGSNMKFILLNGASEATMSFDNILVEEIVVEEDDDEINDEEPQYAYFSDDFSSYDYGALTKENGASAKYALLRDTNVVDPVNDGESKVLALNASGEQPQFEVACTLMDKQVQFDFLYDHDFVTFGGIYVTMHKEPNNGGNWYFSITPNHGQKLIVSVGSQNLGNAPLDVTSQTWYTCKARLYDGKFWIKVWETEDDEPEAWNFLYAVPGLNSNPADVCGVMAHENGSVENLVYVDNFAIKTWEEIIKAEYTITATSSNTTAGTVSGSGQYLEDSSCTVTAENNPGYRFVCWKENGEVVSTDRIYSFMVSGNRTLTAEFEEAELVFRSFMANGMTQESIIDEENKTIHVRLASDVDMENVLCYFYNDVDTYSPVEPYTFLDFSSGEVALGDWTVYATQNTEMERFYVNGTSGSDSNDGLSAVKAFKTIDKALEAAAALEGWTGDVVIEIANGDYVLDETLKFSAETGAEKGYALILDGEDAEKTVVSSGIELTGWEESETVAGAWEIDAPTLPAGIDYSRDLYINGKRATLARGDVILPGGWNYVDRTDMQMNAEGYLVDGTEMSTWGNQSDIEFVYEIAWTYSIVPVDRIEETDGKSQVYMDADAFKRAKEKNGVTIQDPGYIQNALELLDEPGEWYFDRTAQKIYYIPEQGVNPNDLAMIMPTLDQLVDADGVDGAKVYGVALKDIAFRYASYLKAHYDGHADIQANFVAGSDYLHYPLNNMNKTPGAITFDYAEGIRVEGCSFSCMAAAAVDFSVGVSASTVVGNRIEEIGGSGVQVGTVKVRDGQPLSSHGFVDGEFVTNLEPEPNRITHDIMVVSNVVNEIGTQFKGAIAILAGYTSDVTISHNVISNASYSGISAGWGWGGVDMDSRAIIPEPWETPSIMERYVIENNDISSIMQRLYDGAGVYTLSDMPGSIISGNVIKDSQHLGIYNDEASGGFAEIAENAIINAHQAYFYHNVRSEYADRLKATQNAMRNNYWNEVPTDDPLYDLILERAGLLDGVQIPNLPELELVIPVDKAKLETAIEEAGTLSEEDYTSETWAAVAEALAAAKALGEDATQDEVDAATKALSDAMDALVEKADTTELEAAIADVADLDEDDYTAETWAALEAALAAAKALGEDATQDEVDAATEALKEAIDALEEKSDDPETKVEIKEGGITEVPDTLKEAGLETPDEVKEAIVKAIIAENDKISEDNVVHYDVTLMYSEDGGETWVKADETHFPENGKLTVKLPYPEGTDKTYTFTVAHMFTSDAFGKTPGDVEYPEVTNTEDGIVFEVTGLSPISVGWTAPETDEPERPSWPIYPIRPIWPVVGGAVAPVEKFPFTDVPANAWFYDEVKEAWENDLIDGVTGTLYKPDETLTVAQAIKLAAALHQMYFEGEVTLENGAPNWYDSYVDYAIYNGIIEAKYDKYNLTQMNAAISREEFVHIFFGAMPESCYDACNAVAANAIPDVKMNDTYADEIYTFYRAGILTGSDAKGTFNPDSSIKRSEVAAILIRMYDTNARQAVTLG